jgi:hypothetical protein
VSRGERNESPRLLISVLALTLPTSGGRLVGILRRPSKAPEFFFFTYKKFSKESCIDHSPSYVRHYVPQNLPSLQV